MARRQGRKGFAAARARAREARAARGAAVRAAAAALAAGAAALAMALAVALAAAVALGGCAQGSSSAGGGAGDAGSAGNRGGDGGGQGSPAGGASGGKGALGGGKGGVVGAAAAQGGDGALGPTVVFGDGGWDSARFHNAVAMFVAREAFGIDAQEKAGAMSDVYNELVRGGVQVVMEAWTDNLPTYEADRSAGRIVELSVNFDDDMQGFFVPRYVIEGDPARGIEAAVPGLGAVEDLLGHAQAFRDPGDAKKGRVVGAVVGWDVSDLMQRMFLFYGLDAEYNYYQPKTDQELDAILAEACEKGEPVVAYYWEPTWLAGKYDLVWLSDDAFEKEMNPSGAYSREGIRVTVAVNGALVGAEPGLCDFLSRYRTSSDLTEEALAYIHDAGATYAEAAQWFLARHDELVAAWLPQEAADAVRAALPPGLVGEGG